MSLKAIIRTLLIVVVPFVTVYSLFLLSFSFPISPAPEVHDPRIYFESQISALIKVHKRADIAVRAAFSIYELYPAIAIVMVDDSPTPIDLPLPPTVKYFRIPENTGISFGRNFGVQKIQTTYTLLMDDDWLLTNQTNLNKAFELLESNHSIGLVAGLLCNKEGLQDCYGYQGSLGIVDKKLTYRENVTREIMPNGCKLVDLGENSILARTEVLRTHPWDVSFFWYFWN